MRKGDGPEFSRVWDMHFPPRSRHADGSDRQNIAKFHVIGMSWEFE